MNVGLYFGSFNPIHIGHLIIANHIIQYTNVEQVWFVVSPQNPLKPSGTLLDEYHRLHLVNLAIENNNKLKSSSIEFGLPKPSYTIDTLQYMEEKYPQHRFFVVMGSDSFQNLPQWKNFEVLIKNYSFIVYPRPSFEIKETWNADYQLVKAPLLEISATVIREMIKMGKSTKYVLPDAVREEIEATGYYKV